MRLLGLIPLVLVLACSPGAGNDTGPKQPQEVPGRAVSPASDNGPAVPFAPEKGLAEVPDELSSFCQPPTGNPRHEPRPQAARPSGRRDTTARVEVFQENEELGPALRCVVTTEDQARIVAGYSRNAGALLDSLAAGGDGTLLLAWMGTQASTGYVIRFDSVVARGDTTTAFVRSTSPGGEGAGDMLTNPFAIARVQRTGGPVEFVEVP